MPKKANKRERKVQRQAEMVVGGAGDWTIVDGKFFDLNRGMWVKRCSGCKLSFYAKRMDKKTCSDACRMKVSRANLKHQHGELI